MTWEHVAEQIELKREIVTELLEGEAWELAWVVFKSLDVVSHRAYGAEFERAVAPVYVQLDEALGQLVAAAGEEANVMLVSDHGFHSYTRGFDLQRWLIEAGYSVAAASAPAPTKNDGPLATKRPRDHAARMAALDLARSRAFASTCEGNWGSLRLNLRGREPNGVVLPAEADQLLAEIETRLKAWGEETGLVKQVLRGDVLYPGPENHVVPDLLLELANDVQAVAQGGELSLGLYARAIPDHDRTGVFVAAGPDFRADVDRGNARIFDIAPTALHLLGLPSDTEMAGHALVEFLLAPRRPRIVPPKRLVPRQPEASGGAQPFDAEQVEQIEARLRALGYG